MTESRSQIAASDCRSWRATETKPEFINQRCGPLFRRAHQHPMCAAGRSFAGPVLFKGLTRKRHIAECRSDVADDKIREIPPRLIDRLGLKWPPMPIEFGKNYFRLRCCYSIDIIVEECGSAIDGRLLGFQQLHRKVILHSQRLSRCIIGRNPLWITFSLARRHSNPGHELIFYGISTLVSGTRLSACTPMRLDRSNDRIVHLPPCRRRGCFFLRSTKRRSAAVKRYLKISAPARPKYGASQAQTRSLNPRAVVECEVSSATGDSPSPTAIPHVVFLHVTPSEIAAP